MLTNIVKKNFHVETFILGIGKIKIKDVIITAENMENDLQY
jgi:hypothetical protein